MTVSELIQKLGKYDGNLEVMLDAVDLDTDKLMAVVFVYPDEFYDEAKKIKKVVCLETEVGKVKVNRQTLESASVVESDSSVG